MTTASPHSRFVPESRDHRRGSWAAGILALTISPWVVLALLSRGLLPGRTDWINPILGAALVGTFIGTWACAIGMSRRPRRMLLRAVATSVTALTLLSILEIPAALRWVHWTLVFRNLTGEGVDYGSAYVLDEHLSYRRIPNLRWSGRPSSDIEGSYGLPRSLQHPITFTYDRWGYRNATEMERADVALVGDSFVEGWYVSDNQTVAAQLGMRLGRPVANLGVAGYGTLQALRVLKSDALARQPKVIAWFFFEGNDLYDDQAFENAMLAEPPTREQATPHAQGLTRDHGWNRRSFIRNAFDRIRRWSHPLIPNAAPYWAHLRAADGSSQPVYFFDYGAIPWTQYEEARWAIARAAFEEGVAFGREHGIELVFVYVPTKYRVFRDFVGVPDGGPMESWNVWHVLPELFEDFCRAAAVACINPTERLKQAVAVGNLPYAPTDTHWSPEGHALVAATLEDVIRARAW